MVRQKIKWIAALASFALVAVGPPAPAEDPVHVTADSAVTTSEIQLEPGETAQVPLQSDIAVVGVSWDTADPAPTAAELRTFVDGVWSEWQPFGHPDADIENSEGLTFEATAPMSVTDVESIEVRVSAAPTQGDVTYTLTVIDPRGAEPVENTLDPEGHVSAEQSGPIAQSRAAAPKVLDAGASLGLKINRRSAWGANEAIRDKVPDRSARYRGAVVHHTAHANSNNGANSYSQAQVPGLIRGFYQYHVSMGWGDIGYQLLVDRFGGVWEGRWDSLNREIVATQAKGANFDTFGVAVIGTWDNAAPPAVAQEAVAKTISWMFEQFGVAAPTGNIWVPGNDSAGRTVPVISGHRHIGGTSCPGDAFVSQLGSLRARVASYMQSPLNGSVTRQSGDDRWATAASVAVTNFSEGADTVYVANGLDFPDALAGGPAAGGENAPMLLVSQSAVPAATVTALQKLKPKSIVILGREGVVGKPVEAELRKHAAKVTRYGGDNRFATSADLAVAKFPNAETIYIANGLDYPDALAAVPAAAAGKAPLLLTRAGSIPTETAAAIRKIAPKRIVILGGNGVVNDGVQKQLARLAGSVERLAGGDRYETAAAIAISGFSGEADTVYIATGHVFADALAAGPGAIRSSAPLLLVSGSTIPPSTATALNRLKPKRIVIVGGPGAVPQGIARSLEKFVVAPR